MTSAFSYVLDAFGIFLSATLAGPASHLIIALKSRPHWPDETDLSETGPPALNRISERSHGKVKGLTLGLGPSVYALNRCGGPNFGHDAVLPRIG